MISDILDEIAQAHPLCRMAAYADLGAGMVLVARGPDVPAREGLDALCGEAAIALPEAPPEGEAGDMAILAGADGLRLFLRHPGAAGEALCCLCAAPAGDAANALGPLLADAAGAMERIALDSA